MIKTDFSDYINSRVLFLLEKNEWLYPIVFFFKKPDSC